MLQPERFAVAKGRVPGTDEHVAKYRRRFAPFFKLDPPDRVLDVGAAQGVAMLAGCEAPGLEPYAPAVEVSHDLEREFETTLPIKAGWAEELPDKDDMFRFVYAYSVLEHVDDPLNPRRSSATMDWAMKHRPELVGHTTRPATQWFRHRWMQDTLRGIGFTEVVDRWQMRRSGERGGLGHLAVEAAKRYPAARLLGDIAEPGMEYLAIK